MSYLLANLGRKRTSSRNIECLASEVGLATPPATTMRFREVGEPWSTPEPFKPYFTMELSEALGSKTVELEITDSGAATTTHSHTLDLVAVNTEPSWYPETQQIANKLPQYHKGRRLRTSNWQTFMNGFGAAQSLLLQDISRTMNGSYIQTCPLDELTLVGVVYGDSDKLRADKDPNANLLTNPTLSLLRAPFLEPQDWALNGSWTIDTTKSLFGYNCLRCQPANGVLVTAVQASPLQAATGETLTAGLYYQTSLASTTSPLSAVDFSLTVVLLYEDGDSEISSVILQPGTDARWHLAQLSVTASKNVTKIFTAITIEGQPTISPFPFHIGAVQVRRGTALGSFSFGETEPFMLDSVRNTAAEPSKELWTLDAPREFSYEVIPTRVDPPSTAVAGTWAASPIIFPTYRLATAQLDVAPIGFAASNNKIGMYVTDPEELLLEFTPAFYDQGADGYVKADGFLIETTTVFAGRLWATGYFEDQAAADEFVLVDDWDGFGVPVNGTDRMRYLLCINHLPPAQPGDYMEVLAAYPLVELDVADPIVDLSFQNSDGSVVYFRTTSEERYSRLYYDYGLVRNDASVWLRESDSTVSLI